MQNDLLRIHGPHQAAWPVVLDSPHSGFTMPADFGAALGALDPREGEDFLNDEHWMPANRRDIAWLAALRQGDAESCTQLAAGWGRQRPGR